MQPDPTLQRLTQRSAHALAAFGVNTAPERLESTARAALTEFGARPQSEQDAARVIYAITSHILRQSQVSFTPERLRQVIQSQTAARPAPSAGGGANVAPRTTAANNPLSTTPSIKNSPLPVVWLYLIVLAVMLVIVGGIMALIYSANRDTINAQVATSAGEITPLIVGFVGVAAAAWVVVMFMRMVARTCLSMVFVAFLVAVAIGALVYLYSSGYLTGVF